MAVDQELALSILIWLPNLLWQMQHNFVSLDFLSHIHARDIRQGRTANFLSATVGIDRLSLSAGFGRSLFLFFPRAASASA